MHQKSTPRLGPRICHQGIAHKSYVNSASVVARTAELRCSKFPSRRALTCKITRESSVEMMQILRKKSREKFAKCPEIRHAPRTKNCVHSASVRCAYFTTSLRVYRVSIAFRFEKESVQRRDHANFAPNSRERSEKFLKKFGAPRAQKLRELGQHGCANRRSSLQLFLESACVRMQDNARVQRRDDANFAQKPCENFAKFPEMWHAPRTKIACTRPAGAVHTLAFR